MAADDFADEDDETAWALLAATWLNLRRDPARTGERDSGGKVLAALSAELSWVRGPADRRFVLNTIAANIATKFGEAGPQGRNALIASGLVLFVITLAVNMFARTVVYRRSGAVRGSK